MFHIATIRQQQVTGQYTTLLAAMAAADDIAKELGVLIVVLDEFKVVYTAYPLGGCPSCGDR